MESKISIYCCGGIKKGPGDVGKLVWDVAEFKAFEEVLSPIEVVFLNPNDRTDDVSDAFCVFGRDHFQISICDFIVVDARQKRGIGVGIEMLSAKYFDKPLVTVAMPNSHYRREKLDYLGSSVENYVHAHLFGLSDAIVDNFHQAALWIKKYTEKPISSKGMEVVSEAISAYKKNQLDQDIPMRKALEVLGST